MAVLRAFQIQLLLEVWHGLLALVVLGGPVCTWPLEEELFGLLQRPCCPSREEGGNKVWANSGPR